MNSSKNEINCNCNDYFDKNGLIHTSIIIELDTFESKEDYIVINSIDNSIKINNIFLIVVSSPNENITYVI